MKLTLLLKKLPLLAFLLTCFAMNGQQVSLPYTTNFETNNTNWSTPASWTYTNNAGNGANAGCTGAGSQFYYRLANSLPNRYLFTPTFTGQAGYTYTISFCGRATANGTSVLKVYPATAQTIVATNETTAYLTGSNTAATGWASETSTAWTCPANGTYCFALKATTGTGDMRIDNATITETPPPCSTVVANAATALSTTGFTANWTAAAGTVTGYTLEVDDNSDFSSITQTNSGIAAGTTTAVVTGLTAGTTYYYRVRANAGSCALSLVNSNSTTVATCSILTAPTASAATGTNANTTFTANWADVTGETGYKLEVATVSDFSSITQTFSAIAANATSQAVTGLTANTTYYYRVTTLNSTCTSSPSNTITIATACTAPTAQPTSLSFNGIGSTGLNGSFTVSASANGYLVLRSTSNTAPSPAPLDGTTYTAGSTVGGATVVKASSSNTFSDSGLSVSTTYYYYIYSYNSNCFSNIDYLTTTPLKLSQTTNASAKTWYVNDGVTPLEAGSITTAVGNNANSGLTTALPKADLQSAITAASAGDTIMVDTGIWIGTATQTINKALTIIGNGATNTIFESGSVAGTIRWGSISANDVTLKNLQISKYDRAADGIAINITSGTNILIDNCIIYNNVGSAGQGAVYIGGVSTSVTIKNSSLPCNRTSVANYGGAMNIDGSTVLIENCSMNNNVISALKGGAVLIQGSTANVTITKTTFDSNGAGQGGAIAIMDGTVSISNSCFDSNVAGNDAGGTGGGGAVLISPTSNSTINITNCSFSNNTANTGSSDGGAICFSNYSSPTVTATVSTCSFTNNRSGAGEDINFNKQNSPTYSVTLKNNTFNTIATGVNLYNTDFNAASIKFEGLSSPSGTGGCGDIVADGSGIAITKPEMSGTYTESSSSVPTSLPSTTCNDRFDGDCGSVDATFTCLTQNTWNGSAWSRNHIPTIYEHVILNANYNTTTHGNIDACVLTVNSGITLTIDQSNKTNNTQKTTYVNVINSIINNGTINVSTNGNLIQVNHPLDLDNIAIITPTINLTKNTGNKVRWDYIYWSKPVTTASSIMSNFNTAFDIKYYWDPDYSISFDRNYAGWITLSGEPTVGTGFIARVKTELGLTGAPISLNMAGQSNNGDITAVVKHYDGNDQAFRNFTLLGNPYPGAIYFQDFYNDNSDKIYGTAYLWSSYTQYGGTGEYRNADYATFNLTGGVGTPATGDSLTPNGYIPSGQAFMVRPKVNGTVTFKNAHRTKVIPSNNQFFRPIAPEDKNRFWLRITDSNKSYSEQLIGYVNGSSSEFDEAYDGPINSLSKLKFYSFLENQKLIIQGNGDFNENDKLRIGYSKTMIQNEILTISISKAEGIFSYNTRVYLYDKELNQYHNLSNRPYQFIASTNADNRFEIMYQLPRNEEPTIDANTVVASINNNILNINADADIDSVILYDLTGKLIFEKTMDRKSNIVNTPLYISTGVYIARVTLSNTKTHTLKLIKE